MSKDEVILLLTVCLCLLIGGLLGFMIGTGVADVDSHQRGYNQGKAETYQNLLEAGIKVPKEENQ